MTDFQLKPWAQGDPLHSVDPLGPYAEMYWLPILYPSAYLLGRRLVSLYQRARVADGGVLTLEPLVIAAALGISNVPKDAEPTDAPNAGLRSFNRAMKRLGLYHLVEKQADGSVAVRPRWYRLTDGLLRSLPEKMQSAEEGWWDLEQVIESRRRLASAGRSG